MQTGTPEISGNEQVSGLKSESLSAVRRPKVISTTTRPRSFNWGFPISHQQLYLYLVHLMLSICHENGIIS